MTTETVKDGQLRMDLENKGGVNRRRRIFLDTETTGMNKYSDRIVEVCCIEVDEHLKEVANYHAYINPQRDVPWFVRKIHGLDNKFLADKPTFREIGRDLILFLEGAELYAHNMAFDSSMLDAELKRNGFPTLSEADCSLKCTVKMARSLFPGQKNSLDALLDRFNIDRTCRKYHGAMIDTRLLVDIYQNLEAISCARVQNKKTN